MAYGAERAHRDTQVQIEGGRREKQEAKRSQVPSTEGVKEREAERI